MTTFPAETPETSPALFTVAIALLALDHVPPGVILESVVVAAGQTDKVPVIAATVGTGFIVNVPALVAIPVGVVTLIVPVVAAKGNVAVICEALFTTKAAAVPLNETAVAPVKLLPEITTDGVVPTHALLGLNPVIAGGKV